MLRLREGGNCMETQNGFDGTQASAGAPAATPTQASPQPKPKPAWMIPAIIVIVIATIAVFALASTHKGRSSAPSSLPANTTSIASTSIQNSSVEFVESGLPANSTWSVTYANQTKNSSADDIQFDAKPGAQNYTVQLISAPKVTIKLPVAAVSSVAYDTENNELYFGVYTYTGQTYLNMKLSGKPVNPERIYMVNASTAKLTGNVTVGASPTMVLYDSNNGNIYVGSPYGGTLTVINGSPNANNSQTANLNISNVFGAFRSLAYDSKNGNVYAGVVSPYSNNITYIEISGANNKVLATNLTSAPAGLVTTRSKYTKAGYLYYTDFNNTNHIVAVLVNVTATPNSGTVKPGQQVRVSFAGG